MSTKVDVAILMADDLFTDILEFCNDMPDLIKRIKKAYANIGPREAFQVMFEPEFKVLLMERSTWASILFFALGGEEYYRSFQSEVLKVFTKKERQSRNKDMPYTLSKFALICATNVEPGPEPRFDAALKIFVELLKKEKIPLQGEDPFSDAIICLRHAKKYFDIMKRPNRCQEVLEMLLPLGLKNSIPKR